MIIPSQCVVHIVPSTGLGTWWMFNKTSFCRAWPSFFPPGSPSQVWSCPECWRHPPYLLASFPASLPQVFSPAFPPSFLCLAPQSPRVWTDRIFQVTSSNSRGGQEGMNHIWGPLHWQKSWKDDRKQEWWLCDCAGQGGNGGDSGWGWGWGGVLGQSLLGELDIWGPHSRALGLRESVPRQVDRESRGPQGERGLEFSRRRKGQTFFLSPHSLGLYNNNVSCLKTIFGLNLLLS